MPQRLPSPAESRVLLALYHKGPLRRVQLVNFEAVPVSSGTVSVLLSLVGKMLIVCRDGPHGVYDLTQAGLDLTEVCVKHDLMVETGYRSDRLSRQIVRPREVHREFVEGDFHEVRREPDVARPVHDSVAPEPQARTEPPSPEPAPLPTPTSPAPAPITPAPITSPVAPKPAAKPARIIVPPPRIYSSVRHK